MLLRGSAAACATPARSGLHHAGPRLCGRSGPCGGLLRRQQQRDDGLTIARFRDENKSAASSPQPQEVSGGAPVEQQEATTERCGSLPVDATALTGQVPVVFELGKHCPFGHAFAIVGDTPELGAWDVAKAARLQWSEGDVWRTSVLLPIERPVAFKYVQLRADDASLVEWGGDVAGGGNLTVTVQRSSELISGFRVELSPQMSTETDIAADAAEPSPSVAPYLTARLDIGAVLPVSASFFRETRLAVAAGLPPALADDMITDRALMEQGVLSEAHLQAKWSPQHLAALAEKQGWGGIAGSEIGGPVDLTAGVGLAAGYADAGSVTAAVEEGVAQEPAAGQVPQVTGSGRLMTSLDFGELTPGASPAEQSLDEAAIQPAAEPAAETSLAAVVTDAPSHIVGSSHNYDTASSVDSDASAAEDSSAGPKEPLPLAGCSPGPAGTKIVSANESASTIDIESTPLLSPSRPVVEVEGAPWDVVDPIPPHEPLTLGRGPRAASGSGSGSDAAPPAAPGDQPPAAAAAPTAPPASSSASPAARPRVCITTDGGLAVNMRAADPLSLPDRPEVAAVRGASARGGFGEEAGPTDGLLLPPELLGAAADAPDDAEGADAPARAGTGTSRGSSGAELPPAFDRAAPAAETGFQGDFDTAAKTAAGRDVEQRGCGSQEALLADPTQARAAGLPAQAEGTATSPDGAAAARPGALSRDEEQLAALLAAAAAAAGTVRYAAGAAAVREIGTMEAAVDERDGALLQGPDALPVPQLMAEAAVIGPDASPGEAAGVAEVAEVLREAARERKASRQDDTAGEQGSPHAAERGSGSSTGRGGWWKRWLGFGEDDSNNRA